MTHAYNRVRRGLIALAMLLVGVASNGFAQWATAPDVPVIRTLAMQTATNGKIYVWGGSAAEVSPVQIPGTSTNSGIVLNTPGGTSWSSIAPMPQPRVAGFAAAIGSKIYIVGGVSSTSSNITFRPNVLEYDVATNTFTEKAAMVTPVCAAACVAVGNKIFVLGGITVDDQGDLAYANTAQVYDVVADSWEQLAIPPPYSQFYGTAGAIGTKLILTGGTVGNGITRQTWTADLDGDGNITNWVKIADAPQAFTQGAGGTLNGKFYVAGGFDQSGGKTNKVYRFDGTNWQSWYALPTPLANVSTMPFDGTSIYYISGANSKKVYKLSEGSAVALAAVSPSNHLLTTTSGTSTTAQIMVTNNGVAMLNGSLDIPAEAQGWLSTNDGTFNDVAPGATRTLTLTAGNTSVNAGNYTTTVLVNTNDPQTPQVPVTIKFFVRDELPTQPTKVVVEEATGTWCGYCPDGHRVMEDLVEQFPDRLIALGYHGYPGTSDTFIVQSAYNVLTKLNVQGYPNAAIQRWMFPGEQFQMVNRGAWGTYINQVLTQQPNAPVTIDIVEYKYNASTNLVTAKVRLTTARAIPVGSNTKLRLSAIVAQDSMVSRQTEYTATGTVHHSPYMQRHVVTGVHPDANGQEISLPEGSVEDGVLLPGSSIEQVMTFEPKTSDPSRTEVVFAVHRSDGPALGEIYQGADIHLTSNISAGGYTVNTPTATRTVGTTDTAKFTTDIKNNGTSPVTISVNRIANNMPGANWKSWFCVGNDCTTPEQNSLSTPITVAPGETKTVTVKIAGTTNGTGRMTLKFEDGQGGSSEQEYTATVSGGSGVELEAVAGNGMRLSFNTPNPATSITSFTYSLPSAGMVSVDIFSLTGIKLVSIEKGRVEMGEHKLDLDVSGLPSGTYSVRLNSNGSSVSRMITVVR